MSLSAQPSSPSLPGPSAQSRLPLPDPSFSRGSQATTLPLLNHPPLSEYSMDPALAKACEEAAAAEKAQQTVRSRLHLVVLGHVDAGKSTLMGRLLHDVG